MANLRVVYQNIADLTTATITASSTASAATAVANLKKDIKSLVWRSSVSSTASIRANLVVTLPSNVVKSVILAFTNLSVVATIRVRGFTGGAPILSGTVDSPSYSLPGTTVFDSGTVLANPYQGTGFSNWNNDSYYPATIATTTYTERKVYSRVWIPAGVACTSLLIEIIDTNNINRYVEASRLIIGDYWSPTYNTSFGLSITPKDTSETNRSEAGDLLTSNGIIYNVLNFDLKYMSPTDRVVFAKIIKIVGAQKPLFISLFPDNTEDWEKEQLFQIYGKLSQLYGITHPIFGNYSSQIEIEEI